ncbi:hypothetical protein AK812_SmicGene285 [Symbiodinium microadriaticum]|uniref:Uncharacterized protein n=1 Tax=Symbiodinium microadriaticum TaxID=2951 RepID=A0A1Q9F6X4_SYMMI|nr:hypothetical protein AK812_SmicGene285 [Symbiodinium microadriaticum]
MTRKQKEGLRAQYWLHLPDCWDDGGQQLSRRYRSIVEKAINDRTAQLEKEGYRLSGHKVNKWSKLTDALHAAILKSVCDRLQEDVTTELLPVEKAALTALAQVCTLTSLKILRSKSASQKQPTLKPARGAWHGGGYGGQNAESSDSRAVCTLNANTVSDRLKELAMMLVMSIILIRGEYGPHGEDGTSITMIALKTTEYEDGESKEELGIAADDGGAQGKQDEETAQEKDGAGADEEAAVLS